MGDLFDDLPRHREDFGRVFDLEDPSPYFAALRPSDYRMPETLAGALKAIHPLLCTARGAGDTLRVLDLGCGYGTVGALLRHDVSMREIYAWYGERHWQPADARRHWAEDAAFFASRRAESVRFEIGGIDTAGIALEYAASQGFIDRSFKENLVDHAPGNHLARFLQGVDLVVESGLPRGLLPVAIGRILDCGGDACRPWFLYSPRPDTDWTALNDVWAERGYRNESYAPEPVRYRKPLGAREREDMLRNLRALGKSEAATMDDGYLLVDMTLAKPEVGSSPLHAIPDTRNS